jgi:hypothetical protein
MSSLQVRTQPVSLALTKEKLARSLKAASLKKMETCPAAAAHVPGISGKLYAEVCATARRTAERIIEAAICASFDQDHVVLPIRAAFEQLLRSHVW